MPRQSSAFTSHSRSLFSMRKKPDDATELPLYHKRLKKGLYWPRFSPESLVHLIPLIIFICFFILWWFSYPVTLNVKDGVISVAYRDRAAAKIVLVVDLSIPNGTSTFPPHPWMSEMPTAAANETVIFA